MANKTLLETGYSFTPAPRIISATGTVGSIVASATSPWTATITGMASTTGLVIGSIFTATDGTGSEGTGGTYRVVSFPTPNSITYQAAGGTTPVAGTVTNITAVKQITIPRFIAQERLISITDLSSNQVIYNLTVSNLRSNLYSSIMYGANGYTTIVPNFDTSSLSIADKLQIVIDEYAEKFDASEVLLDPVNKLRTSQPQALIDTDFEYGTQVTKWENLVLTNNRPSFFPSTVPLINVSAITMNTNARLVTITLSVAANLPNGTPIVVQDSALAIANGNFVIETGGSASTTSVTYTAKAVNLSTITALYDANKTAIFQGTSYTGAQIGAAPTVTTNGLQVIVTTTVPHALSIGNEIYVTGLTGTNPPNGNFVVGTVVTPTKFIYYANPTTGTPATIVATAGAVYARPQGQITHRAFDGGVLFSNNSSSNNQSTIRQTRRYFRYQSGKGIQMSTGTIMRPYATLDSLTSSTSTVTVSTREQHNIQTGATVLIAGANEFAYNGTFVVTNVLSATKFQYTTAGSVTPSSTTASGLITLNVINWFGATNRLGIFDSQNGLFWEYDGTTLSAVRRNSVFQLGGKVSVTNGSNTVTQTNAEFPTSFSKQLVPNDSIVIRGQSYKVLDIASDTSMTISPPYRGTTATLVVVSKTQDTKVAQSAFNLDRLDGTGPSGFNIDLSKMQMFYIDYSWYGAGFIRFGVRGTDGSVVYAHKIANNNVNNEAYMRSGNLPAHYETVTQPITTQATASIGASDTSITVVDTSLFPSTGTLVIRPSSTTNEATQNYEYVNYTGKTATTFTGLTRGQAGSAVAGTATTWTANSNTGTVTTNTGIQVGQRVFSSTTPSPVPDGTFVISIVGSTVTLSNAVTAASPNLIFAPSGIGTGTAYTYSATSPISIEYAYPSFAPAISHWGSSVIMDGRFDDDKSLIFNYGQSGTTFTAIATGVSKAMFSIRVAPSVDSGLIGAFGTRELINRMQLKMTAMDIASNTAAPITLLVRAYLNAATSTATTWQNAVGNTAGAVNSSLAQIADHGTGATTVTGGEVVGGYYVANSGGQTDLTQLRDLGNAVLGGGTATSNTGIYPDGPDTLTIVVTNLGAASVNVQGRISWTEAQA